MSPKMPVNKKLILVSVMAVGLVAGITLGIVLPTLETNSSSPSSPVSAQAEKSIVPLDQKFR